MEQLLAFLRAAPGASLLLHNPLPASRSLPEALQAAASQILLSTHLRFPCDVAGFTISTMMGVTSSRECVEAMAILLPSYRPHRVPPLASGIHGAGGEASCRGVIPPVGFGAGEGETKEEMATKRCAGTLGDKGLRGEKVFLSADLNVLLDDGLNIIGDNRIRASMPSIKFLMGKGAKVVLANHLAAESNSSAVQITRPPRCATHDAGGPPPRLRIVGKSVNYEFIPELDWPWHIFIDES
ncbi:unnamed protein product [Triticum turgidum subsp. durum]|uniref:Phosphoglycerate kinase n=1 Tax=Triticum turgidum subsp. durum TaxID=4567 RepID=A0A9R1NLY9_TRITD|nr:unnamed protein product [Triticum turgidum subsp. durum]